MINLKANKRFKEIGAKWNGKEWIAHELSRELFEEIKKEFYEDNIIVEIKLKEGQKLKGMDWTTYCHARTVGGYIVATAKDRDGGANIASNVACIEGSFKSGGSIKNFMCVHTSELTLRMQISKNALKYLDEESEIYTYKIIK